MDSISLEPGAEPSRAYCIRIGAGLWPRLAADLRARPLGVRYALITDHTVRPLHAEVLASALLDVGLVVDVLEFSAGEVHKTRETKADLEDRMVELGIGRDGAVIAVGGGVVGDLAGFVAATYHRGIPYLQVPTTLLAMVDAAIGGKTGLDLPGGKNLTGAFHHPHGVWADLATLETLPDRALSDGFAEMIKCAAVADADLLGELERDAASLRRRETASLRRAVAGAVRRKVALVACDPREAGRRALLNFGHTVGHALEAASGYGIRHGEAVAMGMIVESDLSSRRTGFPAQDRARLRSVLRDCGLPGAIPANLGAEAIWKAARRDKKARRGEIRCVLLRGMGEAARSDDGWTFPVERDELVHAIRRAQGEV